MVTFTLLLVGGFNWLLVGLVGQDVGQLFLGGQDALLSKIVYVLVGLSAIAEILSHKASCKLCVPGGVAPKM